MTYPGYDENGAQISWDPYPLKTAALRGIADQPNVCADTQTNQEPCGGMVTNHPGLPTYDDACGIPPQIELNI